MKSIRKVLDHYEQALKAISKKQCADASKHLILANRFLGVASESIKLEPQGVQADFKRTVDSVNRLGHQFGSSCTCVRKLS